MAAFRYKLVIFSLLSVAFFGYSAVLYVTVPEEEEPAGPLAQQGKILWQQKNCISCHQLYGLGGHLGPDLTNVAAIRSDEYIRAFLQSGTQVMPDFHLNDQEIRALIEFFRYTNTTGKADPKLFSKNTDGTISQP